MITATLPGVTLLQNSEKSVNQSRRTFLKMLGLSLWLGIVIRPVMDLAAPFPIRSEADAWRSVGYDSHPGIAGEYATHKHAP